MNGEVLEGFDPFAKTEEERTAHWKAALDISDSQIDTQAKAFEKAIKQQVNAAAAAITRGDTDPTVSPAPLRNAYADLYNEEVIFFATATFNAIEKKIPERLKSVELLRLHNKRLRLHIKVAGDDELSKWGKVIDDFLDAEGAVRMEDIDDTTKAWINKIIAEGGREGWGPIRTAKEMRDRLPEFSKFRSERIARTELISALNFGSLEGAISIQEEFGLAVNKRWLTSKDQRVRRPPEDDFNHVAANGEVRGVLELFTRTGGSLRFPGDPGGAAANVINCRCTLTFELADEGL